MSAYSDELRRLNGKPPLKKLDCPLCCRTINVNLTKKEGPNQGREFISCKDCDLFEWLDMPECNDCGRREFEGTVKDGKNEGRRHRSCPNRCSFGWVGKTLT